jgi:hypothetical protein
MIALGKAAKAITVKVFKLLSLKKQLLVLNLIDRGQRNGR